MLKQAVLAVLGLAFHSQTALCTTYEGLPWNTSYPDSPEPWTINVDRNFIETTRFRVSLTRLPVELDPLSSIDGPSVLNATAIRDYWVGQYDWSAVQERLNRFHHHTTTVTTGPGSNYTEPIPLHFVHHRSEREDAIPLIFFHGWPGSWLEIVHIIDLLTNPSDPSDPAFHVVVPSVPGFGFSPAPLRSNFGNREAAQAGNALMKQLGYNRYVAQGGDFGGIIIRWLAAQYPDNVISIHSNFWVIAPNENDWQRYTANESTAEEVILFERLNLYTQFFSGYRYQQQTKPLQLAYAMTDSPFGFAMWIYNLMLTAVDYHVWTPEEVITWSLMYYLQGPYAGFHHYSAGVEEGSLRNPADSLARESFPNAVFPVIGQGIPFVEQPVSVSEFPFDIWSAPLDWATRGGNVVQRVVNDRGGHFAAYEAPDLLANDIRNFWGNASLSGVGEFQK